MPRLIEEPSLKTWVPLRERLVTWQRLLTVFLLAVIYWRSAIDCELNPVSLVQGTPHIVDIVSRMLPPNFSIMKSLIRPTVETLEIAIWGTTLAVIIALPLGVLGAQNLSPNPILYTGSRLILNALRAISELVFALIFVAAVGLGPFPGVLALAVHSAGQLGKFYAEAMENIDRGPLEALEATGAHKIQTLVFAVVPQIVPEFITYTLYRWEVNVRAATVLGLVGAGGIGFELLTSMRLFQYQDTSAILLVILLTVSIVDFLSGRIRRAII
ncbi:MAG: phosphonate ABC transporter, permease protein PhnE [Moorellaceae bacterium]